MTTTGRAAAVAEIEREILAAEGPWHVEGRYYANDRDAGLQRHRAAERILYDRERRRTIDRDRAREFRAAMAREEEQRLSRLLVSPRQMAERQRAFYEATGELIVGDESGYMLGPWAVPDTPSELAR